MELLNGKLSISGETSPLPGRGLGRGFDFKFTKQSIQPSLEFVSSPQCLGFAPRSQSSAFGTSCLSAPSVRYPDSLRFVRPQIRLANKFFSLPRRDRCIAFTLAEVLITLGVIGVVAAITMPTLIKNYQKYKTVNQLKKVYTVLNQAFKMSEIDNDAYENWSSIVDMGGKDYTEKYWQPYLKVVKTCSNLKSCGYKNNNPWMNLNNTKEASVNHMQPRYSLITNDGTLLVFAFYNNNHVVAIDVNGTSNPNQYGKDLFLYHISKKGVRASGTSSTSTYCSKTHTGRDNGEHCSGKIMVDGWKIKDNYPW